LRACFCVSGFEYLELSKIGVFWWDRGVGVVWLVVMAEIWELGFGFIWVCIYSGGGGRVLGCFCDGVLVWEVLFGSEVIEYIGWWRESWWIWVSFVGYCWFSRYAWFLLTWKVC